MDPVFTKSSTRLCKFKLKTRKRFCKNPPDAYITRVLSSAYVHEPALMKDAPLDVRRNLNLILNILAKRRELTILRYVDPNLLKNKSAVKRLLTETKTPKVFDYAKISVFDTKAEVTELLAAYPSLYDKVDVRFQEDKSIAEPYLQQAHLNRYIFPNLPAGLLNQTDYLMPFITRDNISMYFWRWDDEPRSSNPFLQKRYIMHWLDQFGPSSVLPVLDDSMRLDEEIGRRFTSLCTNLHTLAAFTTVFRNDQDEIDIKNQAFKKVVVDKEVELFVKKLKEIDSVNDLAENYVDLTFNVYKDMLLLNEDILKSSSFQSALDQRLLEIGVNDKRETDYVVRLFEERKEYHFRKYYAENLYPFGREYHENRRSWLNQLELLGNFEDLEHFLIFKDRIMASHKFAKYDYGLLDELKKAEDKLRKK
jgi:hypothetical protein